MNRPEAPHLLMRGLYPIYRWLIYFPLACLLTGLFAILAVTFAVTISPRFASTWAGRPWGRALALLAPAPVKVSGVEHIDPQASYVIVANHSSTFDIFALYGWLGIDFRWVIKKELRHVPAIGPACAAIGHIFIDRSNTQGAIDTINEAKKSIGEGTSVLFFPEGTRGPGEQLLPFKKGAFHFAKDLDLPILPVSIIGAWKVLPEKTFRLFPGPIEIRIHPSVPISGSRKRDLLPVVDSVRRTIGKALAPVAQP